MQTIDKNGPERQSIGLSYPSLSNRSRVGVRRAQMARKARDSAALVALLRCRAACHEEASKSRESMRDESPAPLAYGLG